MAGAGSIASAGKSGATAMANDRHVAGPHHKGPGHRISHTRREREDLDTQIARLADLSTNDLRAQWVRFHQVAPPPKLRRDMLIRGVAWKMQERVHGGLSSATKRRLRILSEPLPSGAKFAGPGRAVVRPGARLVREWRGRVHTVSVVEGGFEYDGRRWRSLSEIAQAITGAHWSGPRFFGLAKGRAPSQGEKGRS